MSSSQSTKDFLVHDSKAEDDPRFELLFKRNLYLEKEFARVVKQLTEEKEINAVKSKQLQLINELTTKLTSLQARYAKMTERVNDYHCQVQRAQSETIGLRRKITGVLGHIRAAIQLDIIPGTTYKDPKTLHERLDTENKLIKWKLNLIEGYLSGMFSEKDAT